MKVQSVKCKSVEKEMKMELMFLHKAVANQDQMIAQLNTKLLEQQWSSMQKNLIISGLLENEKETDAELENLVNDFFHNILHMDYNITYKVAHRLGKPKKDFDQPVVVRLNDPKDYTGYT